MNRKQTLMLLTIFAAVSVIASDTKLGKPALPTQATLNPNGTKTPSLLIVPKLEHVATTDISATNPAYIFMMRIENWKSFPAETLSGTRLPPNPCKMALVNRRYWVELYRVEGGAQVACMPVNETTLQSFSFRDYKGSKPPVYAVITDLKTGKVYQSKPVATNDK